MITKLLTERNKKYYNAWVNELQRILSSIDFYPFKLTEDFIYRRSMLCLNSCTENVEIIELMCSESFILRLIHSLISFKLNFHLINYIVGHFSSLQEGGYFLLSINGCDI